MPASRPAVAGGEGGTRSADPTTPHDPKPKVARALYESGHDQQITVSGGHPGARCRPDRQGKRHPPHIWPRPLARSMRCRFAPG